MTDGDHPVPVTIRPAVPVDQNKVAQAMDLPSRKGFVLGPVDPQAERLPPDEIERLNTERKQNIERKKKMGRPPGSKNKPKQPETFTEREERLRKRRQATRAAPKRDRHEPGETNLATTVALMSKLERPELTALGNFLRELEGLPSDARRRIIAALASVYP